MTVNSTDSSISHSLYSSGFLCFFQLNPGYPIGNTLYCLTQDCLLVGNPEVGNSECTNQVLYSLQPIHFNNMQHEVVFFWLRLLILIVSLALPIINVAFFKKTLGLYSPPSGPIPHLNTCCKKRDKSFTQTSGRFLSVSTSVHLPTTQLLTLGLSSYQPVSSLLSPCSSLRCILDLVF